MNKRILFFLASLLITSTLSAQTIHASADFNNSALPAGWTTTAITGSTAWSFGLDGSVDHAGNNNLDGTAMAYFDDSQLGVGSLNNTASLTTPAFNNASNGATFLEFDYNFRQFGATVPDEFYVEVFDGTNWNKVFSKTTDDCGNYLVCTGNFPHAVVNISAFANAACQVRFVYFDGNDWGWYVGLDNVVIYSPLADDIGVQRITYPESTCGLSATDSVKVMIYNYGANAASGFSVSYIINNGTPVTEPVSATIPGSDSLEYTFTTSANFSTVGFYNIDAYTTYSSDGAITNDSASSVVENEPAYVPNYTEGFENGLNGWSIANANPSWAVGAPAGTVISAPAGGNNAVVTNLSGPYNLSENSSFVSPCFDFSGLTAEPEVRFSLYYNTESPFDRAWLEVSVDEGQSWTKVNAAAGSNNWYNNNNLKVWTGNSNGWITAKTKLTGTAGISKVLMRFRFQSDGSISFDGIGIDNFAIIVPQQNDLEVVSLIDPVASAPCGFGSNQSITIRLFNNGQNPITSFDAGYIVNNGTPVLQNNVTPSSPIAPGGFYNHTFTTTTNLSAPGIYNLDIFATTTGDSFTLNDSLNNVKVRNASIPISFFTDWENDVTSTTALGTSVDGWVQTNPNNINTFRVNSGGTSSFGTGPTVDHTTGTAAGKYVYLETSTFPASTVPAELESPCLNLGNSNGANLSFWYHMHGATIGDLKVEVFDGSGWTLLRTISGQQQQNQTDPWLEEVVSLSAYAGSSIKVRFLANRTTSFTGDIAIDDILVYEPLPQDVQLSRFISPSEGCGLTSNSTVTVELENFGTAVIPADSVYVYYKVNNLPAVKDTLNVGIPLGGAVNHTFTVGPDLSVSGQTYNIKVWGDLNGDSNVGNDTIYLNVTNNVKTLPYSQNFSTFFGQNPNDGWTFDPNNTGSGIYWTAGNGTTPTGGTGPNFDHTSGNASGRYIYLESSSNGGPAYFISPCIDLTTVNGAVLSFWYHKYGAGMNDLFVDVFDNSLGLWINNIGVIRGQTQTSGIQPWKEIFVNLSQFVGKQINFRFRGLDDTGSGPTFATGDMAIDDVLIFEPIPQDAKVDSLISPESGCDLTPNELVCVNIENFGTQDITKIKVGYSINNGPPSYDSASGILILPGAKLQFCLNQARANLSAPGNYNFKIWTDLIGDSNVSNDTLYETVINETILFPDCEDFESVSNGVGEGGPDILDGKFSNNWIANTGTYTWEFGARPSSPGPSNDHSPTGPGRYMVSDPNNGNPGNLAILTSPCYDLTTVAVANLEFWYHQFGSANSRMYIDIFDGSLWNNSVDSIVGSPQSNRFAPWQLKRISLADYTGDFINVRFRCYNLGGTYTIDDVCIVPPPPNQALMDAILRPQDELCFYSDSSLVTVRMKNIGSNNIDSLQVRIQVDTLAPVGVLIDTTVWAYPINAPVPWRPGRLFVFQVPVGIDLSFYKTYRIRASLILSGDLDPTDDFIANYRITHQDPIKFPYTDGFETISCTAPGPNYGNGFTRSNGTYKWRVKCGPDRIGLTGPARDHTRGNNFGRYFVTDASAGEFASIATLETPCFDLTTLVKPTFRFWYHMFGFQMGELFIDINADNGWVTLDSILGQQQINNGAAWIQRNIDLSAYAGTYAKIRFRSKRGDGNASDMAVDDLFVYDLSEYDIGPVDVERPGSDNFSCYTDTQSVHVRLLNYGARDLDFTVDTMNIRVEIFRDGQPWDTLFREINSNIYFSNTGVFAPLPSDSLISVWVNNSSDGNSTFDMSQLGSTFTFNVTTTMKRDSVQNNDAYTEDITTQIAGGTVAVNNNSICNGTLVKLNATGFFGAPKWERKYFGPGGTSFWLPEFGFGSDSAEYFAQPDTTAWYRVRICGSDVVSDSVLVNVTVVKTPDPIHDTICGGGQMTVEAYADPIHNLQAVNWYENEFDSIPFKTTNTVPFTHTAMFTQTDTFWLEGVIDSCVSLSRSAVYAVVNPYPVVDLGAVNDTVCQDTNKVLNGGAGFGYTYNWLITGPNGFVDSSDMQTVGVNPLDLEVNSTYSYQVTVTSPFGCQTISNQINVYIEDSCFVGIKDIAFEDQFVLYPNPANDIVHLSFNGSSALNATVEVQSIGGKQIWIKRNQNIDITGYQMNLGKLAEGIYLVKVTSDSGTIIKKLILY